MRFAIIENGTVTNVIEASQDWITANMPGAVQTDTAGIGWTYSNGTFTAPPIPQPTQAQIIATLETAVQNYMDAQAKAAGFDSLLSVISYEGDPNPTWAAQGASFKAWRSAVWAYCYSQEQTITSALAAGQSPTVPTTDQLIAALPVRT